MEILVNVNAITRIEVKYAVLGKKGDGLAYYPVGLKEGLDNPDAVRMYAVFCGSEKFLLSANPNSAVVKVIEEIYKNSIKDKDEPPQE
jgi:hypothetical protein